MRKSQCVVLCLAIVACGKKTPTTPSEPPPPSLTTYVAQASAIGAAEATAVTRTGNPPAAGSGPRATVISDGPAVSDSATLLTINGSAPFRTVYVYMSGGTQDHLQIDLPSPQTSVDVRVRFGTTLPSSPFELFVQLVGSDGSVGLAASTSKEPRPTGPVVVTAVVYSTFGINPGNPTGPGRYGPPVAGARVSSSLDSATTTTNANGVFELRTNTPFQPTGQCFTLTIAAPGFATYSTLGWKTNGSSPDVHKISLAPPMPSQGTTDCR